MKKLLGVLSLICLLAFSGQAQAFGFGFRQAVFVQPSIVAVSPIAAVPVFAQRHVGVVQAAPIVAVQPAFAVQRAAVVPQRAVVVPQRNVVVRQRVIVR